MNCEVMSLPPGAQDFLRRALELMQEFDEEGSGILPVRYWRAVLDELKLDDDSEGAYLIMDFVEAAGKGFFSYVPLVDAVGSTVDLTDGPATRQAQSSTALAPEEYERGYDEDDHQMSYQVPDRNGHVQQSIGASGSRNDAYAISRNQMPYEEDVIETQSVAPTLEVVDEHFWSRRGAAIQHLYSQWDCNRIQNEAFQAQMQEVLGESVDVCHPESEFLRLISKHRTARTMKFVSLMSGLRRDAHNTLARRSGQPCLPCGVSSYAGSQYEASEVGSDASSYSHAAGRPSGGSGLPGSMRTGRKHFALHSQNPVAPDNGGYGRGRQTLGQVKEELDEADSRAGDFWTPAGLPRAPAHRDDRFETMSVASEAVSIADSQREAFSLRNRTGHGNILTWGNESRAITPPKTRQSRQLVLDPAQGIPRSNVSSDIFNRRR